MTAPSLTPDGYMCWPPRDWLESLCVPQPDGTWLVQTPPLRSQEPRLYLLPDQHRKDSYVTQATRLIWVEVALLHWSAPVTSFPLFWLLLPFPWSMILPAGSWFSPWPLFVVVGVLTILAPIVLIRVCLESHAERATRRSRMMTEAA